MFRYCTGLTSFITHAPAAIEVDASAYMSMFTGDTALTTFTATGATTVGCYYASGAFMSAFQGCSSLASLNFFNGALMADCAYNTFNATFESCAALTAVPSWTIEVDISKTCYFMFNGCTHITSAKNLVIRGIMGAQVCQQMFSFCSNLVEGADIQATEVVDNASGVYSGMYYFCYALQKVLVSENTCYFPAGTTATSSNVTNGMFRDCTALEDLIPLTATAPNASAYTQMYYGCTQFSFSTTPSEGAIVYRIPTEGTLTTSPNLTNMFYGATGLVNGTPEVETTYYVTILAETRSPSDFAPLKNGKDENDGKEEEVSGLVTEHKPKEER